MGGRKQTDAIGCQYGSKYCFLCCYSGKLHSFSSNCCYRRSSQSRSRCCSTAATCYDDYKNPQVDPTYACGFGIATTVISAIPIVGKHIPRMAGRLDIIKMSSNRTRLPQFADHASKIKITQMHKIDSVIDNALTHGGLATDFTGRAYGLLVSCKNQLLDNKTDSLFRDTK